MKNIIILKVAIAIMMLLLSVTASFATTTTTTETASNDADIGYTNLPLAPIKLVRGITDCTLSTEGMVKRASGMMRRCHFSANTYVYCGERETNWEIPSPCESRVYRTPPSPTTLARTNLAIAPTTTAKPVVEEASEGEWTHILAALLAALLAAALLWIGFFRTTKDEHKPIEDDAHLLPAPQGEDHEDDGDNAISSPSPAAERAPLVFVTIDDDEEEEDDDEEEEEEDDEEEGNPS